jgi:hypothetical protein
VVHKAAAMHRNRVLFVVAIALAPSAAWAQGDPLGPEFRVNTFTTAAQRWPSATADASGNFVVVWDSDVQDGSDRGIFGQRYSSAGIALGSEFRVNSYTTGEQAYPRIASDASGNFVVVWRSDDQEGGVQNVYAQRFAASGSPLGSEFRVNANMGSLQVVRPNIATDSSGNFVVVWTESGLGFASVVGQRYASSGNALGTAFRVNVSGFVSPGIPAVAMDPVGNFVVVRSTISAGPNPTHILGRRFASTGAPLGSEFRVDTSTPGYLVSPDVAVDASGNFVVVWNAAYFAVLGDLYGQRYASNGTPVGSEFQIATSAYDQYSPSIASDAAGNFVVVWLSDGQDGSGYGAFGQRYASDGALLGTEFRVNTYTTGWQFTRDVAADPAGHFVVVWESLGQDGSTWGVFGQRYAAILPVELMHFRVE